MSSWKKLFARRLNIGRKSEAKRLKLRWQLEVEGLEDRVVPAYVVPTTDYQHFAIFLPGSGNQGLDGEVLRSPPITAGRTAVSSRRPVASMTAMPWAGTTA